MFAPDLSKGSLVRQLLEEALKPYSDSGPFTRCSTDDVVIDATFDADKSDLTYSYSALSPRGALFLGELTDAGFFGDDTRQLLQ